MTATVPSTVGTCDALLADGSTVHVRPISPDDAGRLVAFHSGLSAESIYLRYFSSHGDLRPEEVHRFTNVDGRDRMALVATFRDEIIGVARYDRLPSEPAEAEVAFIVSDHYQGRGVATLLLEVLAAYARTQAISHFRAETLWQNTAMQNVFRDAGFDIKTSYVDGVVDVRMGIQATETLMRAVDRRDEAAEVNSVRHLLCPTSVAVIGAGPTQGTIGHELLRNILEGGFKGSVHPIHPTASEVLGRTAYATVREVPGEVELAVVAVPAGAVPAVVDDCAAKGVKDLVLITAGFAEAGESGRRLQKEIVARARSAGMRVVGPNCMGIINTAPSVSLNATFAAAPPDPGRVAFASQSGGLGIAVLEEARRRHIGLSSFVSVGNKADISGNDLLQYWDHDPDTDVILLYLESFGNPRRFSRIARRVSASKPIVAVKAGRSRSGRRAASSHTAALASPDTAVDALFEQTGVIRVDTLGEMFDTAQVLSDQPVPKGRRVAIVGNAGGPCILAADACEANGLAVPELGERTQSILRSHLPAAAALSNPVDMVASAGPEQFERTLGAVLADDGIDAVVAVFAPVLGTEPDQVASAIARAAAGSTKPIVANFLGMAEAPAGLRTLTEGVPSFCFPEPAVRALARACDYGEWRARDAGHAVRFDDIDPGAARATVDAVLAAAPEGRWLDPVESARVVGAYRIPVASYELATDAAAAAAAAERVGYPVALKASGPGLVHKTESGGVRLSLDSADAVRSAFGEMKAALGSSMEAGVVQAMAPAGVETIVGVVNDESFGPLVMFGSGGTAVELFADRAFRVLPMTDTDAHDLVRSIRGARLLFGYRGSEPVDVCALEHLLLRVASLVEDIAEITEMDMNPVICGPWGVVAVDVKIRVGPVPDRPDQTVRRLR
ncbi:MAG TPA: GNAT family N-acetyltransferase [Acidimicrobiales bacterium]|nr:GNAT family N-acetyltransferase [Acidimicrobiales bacterium]